jgi:hypothetical protein
MFTRILLNVSLALGALSLHTAAQARDSSAQGNDDINVSVTRKGDLVRVYADFVVPVGAPQAFAVLTDYDHIPAISLQAGGLPIRANEAGFYFSAVRNGSTG